MLALAGCLAALVLALLLPTAARAQGGPGSCVASPNVSATDQYCETIPTAQGGVPAATPGAGGVQTLRQTLTPAEIKKLVAAGPLGQALLDLPANTPLSAAEERLLNSAGLLSGQLSGGSQSGAGAVDPIRALARSVSSGGSTAVLLAGLVLATLGAFGVWLLRLRFGT